jgi:chorismate mutase
MDDKLPPAYEESFMKRWIRPLLLPLVLLILFDGQTRSMDESELIRQRRRIDEIDKELVNLLNKRAKIALEIGRIRRRENTPEDLTQRRADEVVRNAMNRSKPPLSPEAVKRIYERVVAEMVEMQRLDAATTK